MEKEERIRNIAIDFCKLTKENQKRLLYFMDILHRCEGLPVEQQQEIFDEIQDEVLLNAIKECKNNLS